MKRLLLSVLGTLALAPASFGILDVNTNGLSDLWEKQLNNGELFDPSFDPQADPDSDGWTNAQEAVAGTNPFESNPPDGIIRPQIALIPSVWSEPVEEGGTPELITPEAITVSWPTIAGKQYTLLYSPDLSADSWLPVENAFIGTGNVVTYNFVLSDPDKLFWRVAVTDVDSDGDGLTNAEEIQLGTNPNLADTDDDGLTDKDEEERGSNPNHADSDGDGLTDKEEVDLGTDPTKADTDGDGLSDKWEKDLGTDPTKVDTDDDGVPDFNDAIPWDTTKQTRWRLAQESHYAVIEIKDPGNLLKKTTSPQAADAVLEGLGANGHLVFSRFDGVSKTPTNAAAIGPIYPWESPWPIYTNLIWSPQTITLVPLAGQSGYPGAMARVTHVDTGGNPHGNGIISLEAYVDNAWRPSTGPGAVESPISWNVQTGAIGFPSPESNPYFAGGGNPLRYGSPIHEITTMGADRGMAWLDNGTQILCAAPPGFSYERTLKLTRGTSQQELGIDATYSTFDNRYSNSYFSYDYDGNFLVNEVPERVANLFNSRSQQAFCCDRVGNVIARTQNASGGLEFKLYCADSTTVIPLPATIGTVSACIQIADADATIIPTPEVPNPPLKKQYAFIGTDTIDDLTALWVQDLTTPKNWHKVSQRPKQFTDAGTGPTNDFLAGSTINIRGEILHSNGTLIFRNGFWHRIDDLIDDQKWSTFHITQLNNCGIMAGTATDTTTNSNKFILLVPADVAVDANRNGQIEFGNERTSASNPYQFWVNHDRDIGHTVDEDDWEEDDVQGNETAETWDIFESGLKWRRDLEDVSRVWMDMSSLSNIINTHDANIKLYARMIPSDGDPQVTLYQAVEQDGGRNYLTDESTGYNQLQIYFGEELCTAANTPEGSEVPRRAWQDLPADKTIHLLFEGKWPGKGKLIFEFRKEGQVIAMLPSVFLDLKKVEDMYETWTVGDAPNPGQDYDNWPAATASQTTGQNLPLPMSSQERDYIMFVHGWNMSPFDKDAFAATAFKRLWHQGYKGRFGAFRWPTFWFASSIPSTDNFDGSEHRAWNSAAPFAKLVSQLNLTFQDNGKSKIRLYAHSMGNIVASESLRQSVYTSKVHTYISAQAALSSHVWDNTTPVMPFTVGGDPCGGEPETPDVYGYYWESGATTEPHKWKEEGRASYMASRYMPNDVRYINHYNPYDWALSFGRWQINQMLKPDVGYHYSVINPFDLTDLNKRFWKSQATKLDFPDDRMEIFSFAAESHAYATGQQGSTGGMFGSAVDLNASPFGFGSAHKGHSAQFRSTIQMRWLYWKRAIEDMRITVP